MNDGAAAQATSMDPPKELGDGHTIGSSIRSIKLIGVALPTDQYLATIGTQLNL